MTAQPQDPLAIAGVFRSLPSPYLVMTPDLVILEANQAYLATVGRTREELVGQPVFTAFPPSPDALDPSGVSRVQLSFERARDTGRPDRMPLQKYDIPDATGAGLVERWWSLTSVPILDDAGRTVLLVQRAEDVTDYVRRLPHDGHEPQQLVWQQKFADLESDLFARAQDLTVALEARELAARRLAGLADLALQLSGAESVADLGRVLTRDRLGLLGADAMSVVVPQAGGGWTTALDTSHGPDPDTGRVLEENLLAAPAVARSGRRLLLLTREDAVAFHPDLAQVQQSTGMGAWAFLPLRSRAQALGCLTVCWAAEPDLSADDLELLEGFAAQLAQTLDRIRATEAEVEATYEVRRLSESLQRSLLRKPAIPESLQVAVRYVPAAQHAQVGGDWYDAFVTTAGTTLLAIGDVTGHDGTAAATMSQIRSLLRGLAYDSDDSPAVLMARLDRALEGLQLDTLATAVLARVETDVQDGETRCRLRWSNAGHLAPVLRQPDGTVELLGGEPNLLLGLDPGTVRCERVVPLEPGSTLVLHTDGLIERRTVGLQEGIDQVNAALAEHGGRDPETVCDHLLTVVAPERNEDDIALLVLRVV